MEMKKYKLIKAYPGSPKVGFILDDSWKNGHGGCTSNPYTINGLTFNPDNHKEFWEEVIEKEYEILSFTCNLNTSNKNPIVKQSSGFFGNGHATEVYYLNTLYSIHSIKRLSDGEIFTIGDRVKDQRNDNNADIVNIFIPNEFGTQTICFELKNNSTNSPYLSDVKKFKKPLFTTEDGINIFPGDKYYKIFIDKNPWREPFTITETKPINLDLNNKSIKRFSTKKAAEDYIINNKPCLSIVEITKELNSYLHSSSLGWQNLNILVKSKL